MQRFPEPGRNVLAGKDLLSVKDSLRKLKPNLPAEVSMSSCLGLSGSHAFLVN